MEKLLVIAFYCDLTFAETPAVDNRIVHCLNRILNDQAWRLFIDHLVGLFRLESVQN